MIDPAHLKDVADTFNDLTKKADRRRLVFLRLLLVIYTPVTSGLFYLNMTQDIRHRWFFLAILLSSAAIVLFSLLSYLGYMLTSEDVAKLYTSKVRMTGKHHNKPMHGRKKNIKLIIESTQLAVLMLFVNVVGMMIYSIAITM